MEISLLRSLDDLRAEIADGLDVNEANKKGKTFLMHAVRLDAFSVLLDAGADPHARAKYGENALFFALEEGFSQVSDRQVEAARRLLELDVAVDGHDILDRTTLMHAASAGDLDIVRRR